VEGREGRRRLAGAGCSRGRRDRDQQSDAALGVVDGSDGKANELGRVERANCISPYE